MEPESAAPSQITRDVQTIVGGQFTSDHLGPLFDEIKRRALASPAEYLRAFETMFLGRAMNPRAQSNLHPAAFLTLLAPRDPARVRQLASRLLAQYDTAMSVADSLLEEEGALEALPPRAGGIARRLNRRRDGLRRLAQPGG